MSRAFAGMSVFLLIVGPALAQEWHVETVEPGGQVGWFSSLALGSCGHPHMSYLDDINDELKYAHWTGSSWDIQTVDAVSLWAMTAMALDSNNHAHIAYGGYSGPLHYAYWSGSSWDIQTVHAGGMVRDVSIVLDSLELPHILYFREQDLWYAYWTGDEWELELVDHVGESTGCGWYNSLALDSEGYAHISYVRFNYTMPWFWLIYGRRLESSGWQKQTLGDGYVGFTSIALDSLDQPQISFFEMDGAALYFAHWTGSQWQIDFLKDGGIGSSIELDSQDRANISHCNYHGPGELGLEYTFWTGAEWETQIIDTGMTTHGEEARTFMVLDDNDCPHMSYYYSLGQHNGDLKYAWYGPVFHLLHPERGEIVTTTTPTLDWQDCDLPGFQDYTLWWGTDPEFATYNEVTGIGESEYTISEGIEDGDRIYWRVKSLYDDEDEYWAEELDWYFDVGAGSGVEATEWSTWATDEYAAYPSPARAVFNFAFSLPAEGRVMLSVYDISGRRIATLVNGDLTAGRHEVSWDSGEIPSGIYLYRLETAAGAVTRRLVVSR